jgi:ribonuclease Z
MRPIFDAALVNRVFGDPGVLIDLKFERRAILFDVGDVTALPTRKLLRVEDLFVSHTHMDHFAGFDHATDFVVTASELGPDGHVERAQFRSRTAFRREELPGTEAPEGLLLDSASFRVRTVPLEHHGIPSLAFAFEEGIHINVWKNRLEELGLPTGPWLTALKQKVRAGAPDNTLIKVHWRTREGSHDERMPLGELKSKVLEFVPGQKVCYVTDVADTSRNRQTLARFLRRTDLLFIEAVFLDEDREHAERKAHLTARAAGEIARAASVRAAIPFHFSPRYLGREADLRHEFERAWHA